MDKLRGLLGTTTSLISPFKDYDIKEKTTRTKFYKVHDGIKKSSNEECSLFVFEKKQYEKQQGMTKSQIDSIYSFVKKEAQTLQRLRHPAMLSVVGVMEETKTHIYYATEPVLASLEDLIIQYRSRKTSKRDSGSLTEQGYKLKDFTFEELEVKSGIFQILEGLNFLNSTAKLLHRNLSPESIFISRSLKWKLAGLGFTCPIEQQEPIQGLSLQDFHDYQYQDAHTILPSLSYLPPEFIYEKKFDYNSDLFSIGRLIGNLSILTGEISAGGSGNNMDYDDQHQITKLGVIPYYKMKLDELKSLCARVSSNFDSARVCSILLADPGFRGTLENFFKSGYFQDILTKSMVYLVNITQKEEESKLQFYRGLLNIMTQFSARIQTNYILPVLLQELVNERLVYVCLPCILLISNNHVKKETFQSKVMPSLAPIFQNTNPKAEVLSCILSNIPLFIQKASLDQVKSYLVPVVLGTLCGPTQELIFQCLTSAQLIFKFLDSDIIGVGVIPRLGNLIGNTFPIHIRSNAINWLTQLVPQMEKRTLIDVLIPNLEKIISNDNSPQILEALVQTYSAISKKLGGELLALKVLPALMQISADKHLDIQQFQSIMKVVKEILTTYESERLNELNNLHRYTTKKEPQSPSEVVMEQFSNSIDSPITHSTSSSVPVLSVQQPLKPMAPIPVTVAANFNNNPITNNPFNNFVSVNSPNQQSVNTISTSMSTTSISSNSNSITKSNLDSPDFTSFNSSNNNSSINISLPFSSQKPILSNSSSNNTSPQSTILPPPSNSSSNNNAFSSIQLPNLSSPNSSLKMNNSSISNSGSSHFESTLTSQNVLQPTITTSNTMKPSKPNYNISLPLQQPSGFGDVLQPTNVMNNTSTTSSTSSYSNMNNNSFVNYNNQSNNYNNFSNNTINSTNNALNSFGNDLLQPMNMQSTYNNNMNMNTNNLQFNNQNNQNNYNYSNNNNWGI
ncbi:SCY1 family protein kinase [Tieghemostelium lacteum]|uniref:SCY1 family protein kinase n=1 Tax=Tieghemostelium lacteum TaxID=361077 RepID=A0A152A4L1_TIELA|nr:SCY1 family protein kinase [Tieghemostelium lacteum]|eukprot:KYR01027.1 SCY1 family protein kinase [Tieghemostelium lacteum]